MRLITRTRVFGLVLIILYLALFWLFSDPRGIHLTATVIPASPLGEVLKTFCLFAVFACLVTWGALRFRKGARLNSEGVKLLGEGRNLAALGKFEQASKKLGNRAIIFFNYGSAKLALWRVEDAVADFKTAGQKRLTSLLKGYLPARLALAHALSGSLGPARQALADPSAVRVDSDSIALLTRAVIFVREEQWSDATQTLGRNELRMLGGMCRGLADALRAWCAEVQHGRHISVDVVGVLGEASIERVGEVWPELAGFLAQHSGAEAAAGRSA